MAKKNNQTPVTEEVVEKVEKVEEVKADPKKGKVIDCERLNVRKGPSIDDEVVAVLKVGTVVIIEPAEDTKEWYKTPSGYVMAKYIKKL